MRRWLLGGENTLADRRKKNAAWLYDRAGLSQGMCLFLAAITRNLSLDRLKERKTAKRGGGAAALALDELSECVSGSPEVEDAVIAKELSESVGRFLDTLPPETRKLFLRRYFFLESAEEIAQMYAMRPGTVTVALHRREKAAGASEREGFFDE